MQKEIKSNEQLKTLLFLQLELQTLEKVYPVFSDLLFFFAKYSFLFETSSPEPASIKPTHTKFETLCSTQDPARDGGNWYGYCRQNPLIYTDSNGKNAIQVISKIAQVLSIYTTFDSGWQLGGTHKKERSLYHQQYKNEEKLNKEISIFFSAPGALAENISVGDGGVVCILISMHFNYSESNKSLIVENCDGFINGAIIENKRIQSILKESSEHPFFDDKKTNDQFIKFLNEQQKLIRDELKINIEHSENLAYQTLSGNLVDSKTIQIDSKEMINYLDAFAQYNETRGNVYDE